jgi:hypothetical protein
MMNPKDAYNYFDIRHSLFDIHHSIDLNFLCRSTYTLPDAGAITALV